MDGHSSKELNTTLCATCLVVSRAFKDLIEWFHAEEICVTFLLVHFSTLCRVISWAEVKDRLLRRPCFSSGSAAAVAGISRISRAVRSATE